MNEYSLRFGQMPINIIERNSITKQIVDDLTLDYPTSNSYIITGIRGCGKTVLLTNISRIFEKKENWIVADVNPEKEILPQIASIIYESKYFKKIFTKFSFNFSYHGFGISIEGDEKISDIKIVLEKMLDYLAKHKIKVLVTIDEISNTRMVRSFIHDFQSLIRKNYEIFILMTGLCENVDSLQNNKALTFLLRCPKFYLNALDINKIKENYLSNFKIIDSVAIELANLTKGYAFAFQVVGLLFTKYKDINKIFNELDLYLSMYVYNKIWDSVPNGEKIVLRCFNKNETLKNVDILSKANIDYKIFSIYRDRLIKRGILASNERGELSLLLPRFNIYIDKNL